MSMMIQDAQSLAAVLVARLATDDQDRQDIELTLEVDPAAAVVVVCDVLGQRPELMTDQLRHALVTIPQDPFWDDDIAYALKAAA